MKRNSKRGILVLIILLAVGFAAVSTTLIINGVVNFGANISDFDVIFTKAVLDNIDVSASVISEDGKTISYTTKNLAIKEDKSVLDFEVTNNSTQYDAKVEIVCGTTGNNANKYYKITPTVAETIIAQTTESGNVVVELTETSVNEIEEAFVCTITATAVERDTIGEAPPALTWSWTDANNNTTVDVGEVITAKSKTTTESFNVISIGEDTITMLASYNLGANYRQSPTANSVLFSNTNGWEYAPGPKEIDIQVWSTNPKTYVNEYVAYLRTETENDNISGDLITLNTLKELGCTISSDYSYTGGLSCTSSSYAPWIVNGQVWWTRSATPGPTGYVWQVTTTGVLYDNLCNSSYAGVRPIITIMKELIN